MTMNKLSTTLAKWRSRSKSRATDTDFDTSTEPVAPEPAPETKSPEFQRRAARAMGQTPVAWYG